MTLRREIHDYWWTKIDQMQARDPKGEGFHPYLRKFVTPYGVVPGAVDGGRCTQYVPGNTYTFRLHHWGEGQVDIFDRHLFHDEPKGRKKGFVWRWVKVPSGLPADMTLGKLCEYLNKKSPSLYPDERYAPEYRGHRADFESTTQAMFDHWDNSEYRYAVIHNTKKTYHPSHYAEHPEDLPIEGTYVRGEESRTVRIGYVPQLVKKKARGAGSRGKQRRDHDKYAADVEAYCELLETATAKANKVLANAQEALAIRSRLVAELKVVQEIALWCTPRDEEKVPSDTVAIADKVANLLPQVEKHVLGKPPGFQGASFPSFVTAGEYKRQWDIVSIDYGPSVLKSKQLLAGLLFAIPPTPPPDGGSAAAIPKLKVWPRKIGLWFRANIAQIHVAGSQQETLSDRLIAAQAAAVDAYAACVDNTDDSTVFIRHLDGAPDSPARTRGDIDGSNAVSAALSAFGKGRSLVARGESLRMKILNAHVAWKLAYGAKAGSKVFGSKYRAGLEAIIGDISKHVAIDPTDVEFMQKELINHHDNKTSMSTLQERITKKLGDHNKKTWSKLPGFKAGMMTLTLLDFVLALRAVSDAHKSGKKAPSMLAVYHYVEATAKMVHTTIGTTTAIIKGIEGMEKAAERLAAIGAKTGIVTGVLGVISGTIQFFDAYEKGSGVGMTTAWLGMAGGSLATWVLWVSVSNPFTATLSVISVALLLASGVITISQLFDGKGPELRRTNEVAGSLVKQIRASAMGRYLAYVDPKGAGADLKALETSCCTGAIPYAKPTAAVDRALLRVGLGDSFRKIIMGGSEPSLADDAIWDAVEGS